MVYKITLESNRSKPWNRGRRGISERFSGRRKWSKPNKSLQCFFSLIRHKSKELGDGDAISTWGYGDITSTNNGILSRISLENIKVWVCSYRRRCFLTYSRLIQLEISWQPMSLLYNRCKRISLACISQKDNQPHIAASGQSSRTHSWSSSLIWTGVTIPLSSNSKLAKQKENNQCRKPTSGILTASLLPASNYESDILGSVWTKTGIFKRSADSPASIISVLYGLCFQTTRTITASLECHNNWEEKGLSAISVLMALHAQNFSPTPLVARLKLNWSCLSHLGRELFLTVVDGDTKSWSNPCSFCTKTRLAARLKWKGQ